MFGPQANSARIETAATETHVAEVVRLDTLARFRRLSDEQPLRCVDSGYLSEECSCQAAVPARVAQAAWARELDRETMLEDRFFRFCWRGEQWLGYGLRGGEVRGVYCPTHYAARDERRTLAAGASAVA